MVNDAQWKHNIETKKPQSFKEIPQIRWGAGLGLMQLDLLHWSLQLKPDIICGNRDNNLYRHFTMLWLFGLLA